MEGGCVGRSEMVRASEVLAASALAAEAREIARDRGTWQRHIANGLTELFDAQVSWVPEVEVLSKKSVAVRRFVEGGAISESDRATFLSHLEDPDAMDPTVLRMLPLNSKIACARRDDLVPDREWYESAHYNDYRRKAGLDPVMFGFIPSMSPQWFVGIGVHRNVSDRPFDRAAPVIFQVLCNGIAELCRSIGPAASPLASVPPRRRAVLERLLAGDSERQTALVLAMSEHAVHAHVKALHKQFGVRSRGELLARFIEGGSGPEK